jgi:putative transposase
MEAQADSVYLTTQETVALLGVDKSTIKRWIDTGKIQAVTAKARGGSQYRILLSSLPEEAQAKWVFQQAQQEIERQGDPRERAERANAERREIARRDIAAGRDPSKLDLEPLPLNQDESQEAWARFDRAPKRFKEEAERRNRIMRIFEQMRREGVPIGTIADNIKREHGVSRRALERWRDRIKGQSTHDWVPLLMPNWKPREVRAEFTEEAWEHIKADWGRTTKPSLTSCYRRAQKLAAERGWVLPSLDAVERRINTLPTWWKKLHREGAQALAMSYPHQLRDYSGLKVHELWGADGRKADVFCRWPDGTVARPIIVAWADVRTRVVLGYEIGKSETADLIRLAFKRAAEESRALPNEALLDNGRGFASKLMTGGQPTRYRFKVKEEEVPGILTLMGISVVWATPGHGQAKPIESWWRTLAEADRRPEFQGAYCGNRPDAKPEDFDPKKAVPIEVYRRIVAEEIEDYHRRAHRGNAMHGQSPLEMYTQLLEHTPVTQPTKAQLRLCLLAAEAVKPNPKDQSISILGNRYWTERCADLRTDRTYVVRFNPEDAAEPVAVYDRDKFLFEAPLIEATGFRNQDAANEFNRARNQHVKGKRQAEQAARDMHRAKLRVLPGGEEVDTETGEIRPKAKLPQPKVGSLLANLVLEQAETPPKKEPGGTGKKLGLAVERLKAQAGQS